MIQFCLMAFSIAALWMALGDNLKARHWAPVVGLIGQPFWVASAVLAHAWGMVAMACIYAAVYGHAIYKNFK
jgi:hypothetical protein